MEKTKVLYATSECVPFIKTGGLSDVAGSLPKYFDRERFDVRVILPRYDCIPAYYRDQMQYVTEFPLCQKFPGGYAKYFSYEIDGVTFYFVESDHLFSGSWPYSDVGNDLYRFAAFCNAVVCFAFNEVFQPDILHCNDWQTALIPMYLRELAFENPKLWRYKTVFTIHNLRFQGVYDIPNMQRKTWLPPVYFYHDGIEFYGNANLMKGAIQYAGKVTTVSETYMKEICTPEYGEGLDGVLRWREPDLYGIVNGIDTVSYDPQTDEALPFKYNAKRIAAGKTANKTALQKELGLEVNPDAFLIGIVSRLTDQKGIDLIASALDEIMDPFTQVVVLGTGESYYEEFFRGAAARHPGRLSANTFFSEALSRRIYAATDAFLMPSRFEPCGLSQLIALRYGSVPIVRETGGLKDTVVPYNEYSGEGTGFSFAHYDRGEFLWAVNYAKSLYFNHRSAYRKLTEQAMKADFSWQASARKYEDLYDEMTGRKYAPKEVK